MATNYYQDPFGAPDYSAEGMPSLFSLSNLESLGRGSVAGLLDLPYFFEGMLMGDQDPRMPQRRRVVPSSEQVLATTPRMTQPTPQAGLLETAGAFMSPVPVAAVKPVAKAVGKAIRATEGLPVGMSIKPINLNKGIYKPELTMEEMLKVKDIPTVDRVKQSIDLVGEKEFEKMVNAQYKKYKPSDQDQEAMLVESVTLNILGKAQRSPYPQQAALDLAQQRAALPVEQGGLGLSANNTPDMRKAAMGGKDMVHFSRTSGDYTTLDSGKFAIAPFDAVGTHVGTPQTAMDRFRNTTATTDQIKGTTYPVTILGDRPLMNQNGMPWGEDDLNAFLRKEGGHNWSDIQGGKMTYQDMNADLRKKLFEKQGYTSIPYFNEVEGKGSISYIVPPENIRSRFAAFDPFRKDVATATAMGVALPDLLAAEPTPEELQRRQPASLLFP